MKSLLASTILIPAWNYPTYFLLVAIALVFIADLLNQYIESKKIICLDIDYSDWSYRDLQAYAKLHGIKANNKRATLINQLQGV